MNFFKNKELRYKYEKNKNKILTIASIIIALVILSIVGFSIYINRPVQAPSDEQIPDEIVREAEYIMNGTKNGDVSLIKVTENKVIDELNLSDNAIYARSNDLDYIMSFANNSFYKISMNDEVLQKEEIAKLDNQDITSFKFSDKYIVALSNNKIYTISLETNKISERDIAIIDKYIIYENYLIYTNGNYIHSLNMDTDNEKSINIGDTTKGLFISNGKIVDFNNFGSGNKSNIIIRFRADDLYIEKEYTHDNNDVSPLTPDSDDSVIPYIDNINKNNITINTHYRINVDKDGGNKKQITLPSMQDDKSYDENNTVSTKGYMYSTRNGGLEITNFESQKVVKIIDDYNDGFFMPILD